MELQTRLGLTRCREKLVERLDVNLLLERLRADDIFTLQDSERINAEVTDVDRARKFMNILEGKEQEAFAIFISTLTHGQNEDILEMILFETAQPVEMEHVDKLLRRADLPMKPKNYVERSPLLDNVRNKLLELSETGGWVVISGMPGHGKTVLAAEALRCPEIAQLFPQGIFWSTFGEEVDIPEMYMQLASKLYSSLEEKPLNWTQARHMILKWTTDNRKALFVMDDVWDAAAASSFDMLPRALLTSRNADVLDEFQGEEHKVAITTGFSVEETKSILDQFGITMSPEDLELLNDKCCGSPFLISIIGAHLRQHRDHWKYYKELLESQRFQDIKKKGIKYAHSNIFEAIGLSVEHLDDDLQAMLKLFAAFESDTFLSSEVFSIILGERDEVMEERLGNLERQSLLIRRQDEEGGKSFFVVHDLVHAFLKNLTEPEIEELHRKIVKQYKKKCGGEWHSLNVQDPYIWWNLARHFQGAGWSNQVFHLFTNLLFIATALVKIGPYAVIKQMKTYISEEYKENTDWVCAQSFIENKASQLAGLPRNVEQVLSALTQIGLGCDHTTTVYKQALEIAEKSKDCFFCLVNPETETHTWKWRVQVAEKLIDLSVSEELRKIFIGVAKQDVLVLDLDSGHWIRTKLVNSGSTVSLDFNEPTKRLVVQGDDCLSFSVIRSVKEKIRIEQLPNSVNISSKVWRVCFESDGEHVIAGLQDGRVMRYEVGSNGPAEYLFQSKFPISSLSVSMDGSYVAVGMISQVYRVFHKEAENLSELKLSFPKHDQRERRRCIAFGRMKGEEVLMFTSKKSIMIWNHKTNKKIQKNFELPDFAMVLASHEEKSLIAGGDRNGTVQVWNYESERLLEAFENKEVERRLAFFIPKGGSESDVALLGASYEGILTCWCVNTDADTLVTPQPLKVKRRALDEHFCGDTEVKLICQGQDENMKQQFIVCNDKAEMKTFTQSTTGVVQTCALDNTGSLAGFGFLDGTIQVYQVSIWEDNKLKEVVNRKMHKHPVCRVLIQTNEAHSHVFSIDVDGYVNIIHMIDNEPQTIISWQAHTCPPPKNTDPYRSSIRILPSQNLLGTSGGDLHVKLWDWRKGRDGLKCDIETGHIASRVKFEVDSNETFIATLAVDDTVVKVWSVRTERLLYRLKHNNNKILACRFYPNAVGLLATSDVQGDIRFFTGLKDELTRSISIDGKPSITTNAGSVQSLVWTPNNEILFGASADKLYAWNFQNKEQKIEVEELPLKFCSLRGSRKLAVSDNWIISMSFSGELYVLHRLAKQENEGQIHEGPLQGPL